VGIALGIWLQPPKPHYGSATPVVTVPQDQPNIWGDTAEASPAPANALPYAQASTDQVAAVSPPAQTEAQPVQVAQADSAQVAAAGDSGSADAASDPQGPTQAAYLSAPPDRAGARRRDAPGYDSQGRDNEDYLDDAPSPGRWDGPPPRRWSPPDDDRDPGPGWNGPPPGDDPDGDGD
jgi:hypothetical protein